MFRGLKEAYFDVFCHISRPEILGAAVLAIPYLIVNLLIRRYLIDLAFQFQLFQLKFKVPLTPYYYI